MRGGIIRYFPLRQPLRAESVPDLVAVEGWVSRRGQGSAALSLCTTAHPAHTRFTNVFGPCVSEATMRPDPRLGQGRRGGDRQVTRANAVSLAPPRSRHAAD